jgi:hypoxanthine phosphoribosyltransferase
MERMLLSGERIQRRIKELAEEIDAAYSDMQDLVLVGVLRGAIYFLADLSRSMQRPHRIDFVEYTSYEGTRKAEGAMVRECSGPLTGADVLLVDEVADTGETLNAIRETILAQQPRSLASCVLLVKPGATHTCPPEFCGFRVGREFFVGFGLDYNQQLRHLPYVAVLHLGERHQT